MSFVLRQTSLAEKDAVSALLLKSYTVLLADAYDADTLQKALPLITEAQPSLLTSGTYFAAESQAGQIVGVGGWTRTSPTGRDETATNGNIRHFGTDPHHAGKGIGRALMTRCIEGARDEGLREFNCYSTLNGEAFYRACGFRTIEPHQVALPGGVRFPSIRMVRPL